MSAKSSAGFTLVEMIVAIVVLGIGLGGVLVSFSTVVKNSADPMVQKQMLAIAEGMMEEITVMPYAPGPGALGSSDCSRAAIDDIGDYQGYGVSNSCGQPRDMAGNLIPNLAGYAVKVSLNTGAALGGIASDVTRITVTVSRGSQSLSLVGYRTNYAKPVP